MSVQEAVPDAQYGSLDSPVLSAEQTLASYLPPIEEELPFADFGKPQRRANAVAAVVRAYASHPAVENITGRLYRYGHEDTTHYISMKRS